VQRTKKIALSEKSFFQDMIEYLQHAIKVYGIYRISLMIIRVIESIITNLDYLHIK